MQYHIRLECLSLLPPIVRKALVVIQHFNITCENGSCTCEEAIRGKHKGEPLYFILKMKS